MVVMSDGCTGTMHVACSAMTILAQGQVMPNQLLLVLMEQVYGIKMFNIQNKPNLRWLSRRLCKAKRPSKTMSTTAQSWIWSGSRRGVLFGVGGFMLLAGLPLLNKTVYQREQNVANMRDSAADAKDAARNAKLRV